MIYNFSRCISIVTSLLWEQLTHLADADKALEQAQLFKQFVQKKKKNVQRVLTLGSVYQIKLLFQSAGRLRQCEITEKQQQEAVVCVKCLLNFCSQGFLRILILIVITRSYALKEKWLKHISYLS